MWQSYSCWFTLFVGCSFGQLRAAEIDYAQAVQPIFEQHCTKCHGEKKKMGKLRLHTAQEIQAKQASDDHLLVAGKPEESELYQRLILPVGHKKLMPKKADPLPKEKIELIRLWIEQGARFELAASTSPTPGSDKPEPKEEQKKIPLPEVEAADQEAIERLAATGAQVAPLFAKSSLLQVSFALRSDPATDADVAQLAEVGIQTYALNLAGAQLSEKGLAVLLQLPNLAQLHLEKSSITDSGLASVSQLANLQYLNLYGTNITDAGLQHLPGLDTLRNLYLWETKVSYAAARDLEKKIPGLHVNLGFDHPEVARRRLTKQIAQAEQKAKEAVTETEKLAAQLAAATKSSGNSAKQLAEYKKELAALNEPEAEEKAGGGNEKEAEEKKEAGAQASPNDKTD